MRYLKNKEGFTLIELMIVTVLTGIIMAGFYTALISQQKSYSDQDQVNRLQQNLRTALSVMKHEIRMAGYDPTHNSGATFLTAGASCCRFTMDITGNGDTDDSNEDISFGFSASVDINGNGIADRDFFDQSAFDAGASMLGRNTGGGFQPMADAIHAFGLAYSFDNDADGRIDTNGAGHIIWAVDSDNDGILDTVLDTNGDGVITAADDTDGDGFINDSTLSFKVPVDAVRGVRIWILGVTRKEAAQGRFVNHANARFVVGNKVINPAANSFTARRRLRLLATTVQCRNMELL
jgi:type IV pilus assembly protein PilW